MNGRGSVRQASDLRDLIEAPRPEHHEGALEELGPPQLQRSVGGRLHLSLVGGEVVISGMKILGSRDASGVGCTACGPLTSREMISSP